MKRRMTRAEARAFKQRWQIVNEFERQELRCTPPEVKLRQFNTLLRWAFSFGWSESLAEGEAEVRARWVRLKKANRG